MKTLRLAAVVPASLADVACGAFYEAELATALVQEPGDLGTEADPIAPGFVRLVAFLDNAERAQAVRVRLSARLGPGARIDLASYSDVDWIRSFRRHHRAVRFGSRLVVAPPWSRLRPRPGRIVLRINPSFAFGTGSHASTHLCLRALLDRARAGPLGRVLDVGTGSGVLAFAALRLGARQVRAIEPDPEALQSARENASLNRIRNRLVLTGEDAASVRGRYDVVTANLIRDLLIDSAARLRERLAPGGALIASGILDEQAGDVRRAFVKAGLRPTRHLRRQGWSALVFER